MYRSHLVVVSEYPPRGVWKGSWLFAPNLMIFLVRYISLCIEHLYLHVCLTGFRFKPIHVHHVQVCVNSTHVVPYKYVMFKSSCECVYDSACVMMVEENRIDDVLPVPSATGVC